MSILLLGLSLAHADDDAAFVAWARRQPDPEVPEHAAGYRFDGRFFREIADLVEAHPGVVETEKIGSTHDGRPIWAFHVEDPAVEPTRDVLVFGGIHALEWVGTEVAADILLELLAEPVSGVRVTVIPLLNPDGRDKVQDDLLAGRNAYRRGNEKNVDLNRDFAVNTEVRAIWSKIIPGYYGHSETPLSQPESAALDALAAREIYDRAVSLHCFGGFLYYPWAGRFAPPPDEDDFFELGRAMEQAQGAHAYRTRQLAHWGFFFRAQGAELDHLYGKYGTRAFLIEMTRSGIEPLDPSTWRNHFRWYNPRNPEPHVGRGVRAVRTLVRHPPLPGELERPAGTPREPD
jgi:hypothetical protein